MLSALIPEDFSNCYPIENLRNMSSTYLQRLTTTNKDFFTSFDKIKQTYRKFKTLHKRSQRELIESSDLLNAWQALNQTSTKTTQSINEMRMETNKKHKELLAKKDEILLAYHEGLQQIKRIELHKNLWKDPN